MREAKQAEEPLGVTALAPVFAYKDIWKVKRNERTEEEPGW